MEIPTREHGRSHPLAVNASSYTSLPVMGFRNGAYEGRFPPTQAPEGPTISGLRSAIVAAPMFHIVLTISSRITIQQCQRQLSSIWPRMFISSLSMALVTPSSPCVAFAYKNVRPNPTAMAPSARSFTTSAPERTPPSTMISIFSKISGR